MDAYVAAARAVPLVLPHLRAVGGGANVNVLAVSGTAAVGNSMPTATSRTAGLALTTSLSKELGPEQIRVNAVLIGSVASGQWRRTAQ